MRNVLPKTVRKDYIKSVTTYADLWCERCRGQRLACGIRTHKNCEDCNLLMPFEAPLKIYNSGPMCILRDVPALDSISSIVR